MYTKDDQNKKGYIPILNERFLSDEKYAILERFMNRKKILFLAILCIGTLCMSDSVVAQGIGQNVRVQNTSDLQSILNYLSFANTVMHIITLMVLYFIQYLLQSDFFSNPAMMSAMNSIWQLSRDLMNIFFALSAIGVALYTIITAKKDFITDKIQNFVLAVVLVNLSWFFPRVIIDVSNILTATVYSIPQMMPQFTCMQFDNQAPGGMKPCSVLKDISIFPDNEAEKNAFCAGYGTTVGSATCKCTSIGCYVIQDFATARNSMGVGHLMINGLVVNFTKILTLPQIPQALAGPGPLGAKQSIMVALQFLMNVGITFIIQVAVLFPMIALVFGLLGRIIIIWITTAFMPLTFLGLVINGKLGTDVFGNDQDIWKEFMGAVFLPVFVAIPITVGFIMLTTVVRIPIPGNLPQTWNLPLISGIGSWWGLLWLVASIAILWKGAFAALSKQEITSGITDQIKGYGDALFSGAKSLPLLTPIPLPNGNTTTLGKALNGPQALAQKIRSDALGGPLVQVPGKNGAPVAANDPNQINAIITKLKQGNAADTTQIVNAINNLKTNPTQANANTIFTPAIKQQLQLDSTASAKDVLNRLKAIVDKNDASLATINGLNTDIQQLLANPNLQ